MLIASPKTVVTILLGLAVALRPAAVPAQSREIDDYVLLAGASLHADHLTVTGGEVAVLDGTLAATRDLMAPASTVAAPLVRLDDEAVCGDLRAASSRGSSAQCAGSQPFSRPFTSVADACGVPTPFPACDPLRAPLVVPHDVELALAPGVYGDVRVEGGGSGPGTLRLAGTYTFCSLRAAREARVLFTGPSTLQVTGPVTAGNAAQIGPDPGAGLSAAQVHVFVAGSLVRFSRRASAGMRLCAPQANLRAGSRTALAGRFAAATIRLRQSLVSPASEVPVNSTSTTTTTTSLPAPSHCGDGVVDPGEVCDGDVPCTSPAGAFLVCRGCAQLSGVCPAPTTTTTTLPGPGPRCGDGVRDAGEQCDDGNRGDCDGCSAGCTIEEVGNGVVDCDEECDDGNTIDCDGCDSDGERECGNGVIDAACGEVCDSDDVGGRSCAGGTVTCAPDCRSVDWSQCPATAPVPQEVCGNCIDDDLNGLIDFEDPACCAGRAPFTGKLASARLRPQRHGGTLLRLRGRLGARDLAVSAGSDDVVIQVRSDGGPELVCARLPAGKFRARRKRLVFRDRHHVVPSAQSLDLVRLLRTPRGPLRATVRGHGMHLVMPKPGTLRVTIGVMNPALGPGSNRCAVMAAPARPARRSGLRAP